LNNVLLINQLVFDACFIESFRAISSIIKPVMPQYEGVDLEKLLSVENMQGVTLSFLYAKTFVSLYDRDGHNKTLFRIESD
jgi:hypothetical protein